MLGAKLTPCNLLPSYTRDDFKNQIRLLATFNSHPSLLFMQRCLFCVKFYPLIIFNMDDRSMYINHAKECSLVSHRVYHIGRTVQA